MTAPRPDQESRRDADTPRDPEVRTRTGAARRVADAAAGVWYTRPRAFVVGVLLIYAAARLFSAVALVVVGAAQQDVSWNSTEQGHLYLRMTVLWDAYWYRQIVENGYPHEVPLDPVTGRPWQSALAFYPLFPSLTRALMRLTGGGFAVVGSTLSLVLGAVAAVLIAWLLRDRVGPRVAVAGVTLWATFMASPVLQVAYTESLAIVVLCGVLWCLTRERWWAAAGVALVVGVTRPIALPLGFVACVSVLLRWRHRRERPIPVREWVAMVAALAACGVSGLIWVGITWAMTGVPTAYTDTMTAWRAAPEIQPFLPWWQMSVLLARWWFHAGPGGAALMLGGVVVLTFGLVLGPWARRLGPHLRAWSFAYALYLFASLDPSTSIFRYLLCQFPIAVVLLGQGFGAPLPIPGLGSGHADSAENVGDAENAGGSRTRGRAGAGLWWVLALGVLINLALQWWWVDSIWRFVPPSDYPP